jgi:hypothetical protein
MPIKITVGGNRTFYVHEKHISSRSDFLRVAYLKVAHLDQGSRVLSFPDEYPGVFNGYLHWLYTRTFEHQLAAAQDRYRYLVNLYVFGEKYNERAFQDIVIDNIVYESRVRDENGNLRVPRPTYIYDVTPEGSPLRQWLVDMMLIYGHNGWLNSLTNELPYKYLEDVVKAFIQSAKDNTSEKIQEELETGEPWSYHHHPPRKTEERSVEDSRQTNSGQGPPPL